ncbi:MAG TPA: hypothetical protein VM840_05750 [Actinomycetota bacterium]|nr:hypothetical protein [Actinomycetota bacterium]
MAGIVRRRDDRALDLYLLVLAICSKEPWDVTLPAAVWTRTLHLTNAPSAVSKAWRRLEHAKLIRRERHGRLTRVFLLREDGSGEPYTHPGADGRPYFRVPFDFWLAPQGWNRRMPLSAKAVLLVGLSLPDAFILPYDRAPDWYGVSADTAARGLRWLRKHDLLYVEKRLKPAPLSAQGYTEERRYTLMPPFGPRGVKRGAKAS